LKKVHANVSNLVLLHTQPLGLNRHPGLGKVNDQAVWAFQSLDRRCYGAGEDDLNGGAILVLLDANRGQ
jgi:hypothetical protein